MLDRNRRFGLSLVLVVFSLAAMPVAARAQPGSFLYTGQCYGYAGEQDMINALENLERARRSYYMGPHFVTIANRYVCRAVDIVCDPQAKLFVEDAHHHLDEYLAHYDPCDLTDAAMMLNKALQAEQLAHRPAPSHGHVHGHSHVLTPAPVIAPSAPPPTYAPQARPRTSFSIGGKRGSFRISF